MSNVLCYMGRGCLGCSFCEDKPLSQSEKEAIERQENRKRLDNNQPSLRVKLGDVFRMKGAK